MNSNEFHINGRYLLFAALIAFIGTISAAVLQVYKPFSQSKSTKDLDLKIDDHNLHSLDYLMMDGLNKSIFKKLKEENYSINPDGKKVAYIKRLSTDDGLKNVLKVVNRNTSYMNEVVLYTQVYDYLSKENPYERKVYCQISIKGWEQPNAIILGIKGCSESLFKVVKYPEIKMKNGVFKVSYDGDHIITFDEFNKVTEVLPID